MANHNFTSTAAGEAALSYLVAKQNANDTAKALENEEEVPTPVTNSGYLNTVLTDLFGNFQLAQRQNEEEIIQIAYRSASKATKDSIKSDLGV